MMSRTEWLHMGRMGFGLVLFLGAASCADNAKPADDDPVEDAGKDPVDSGTTGGSDGGKSTGGGPRKAVEDAPNCEGDNASTPGIDCADYVACGGTGDAPHVCPSKTHSCCVSGLPTQDTVNCFEGTSACQGPESKTPCDGPEDCSGGKVCCVTPPSTQVITECRPAADCDEPSEGTVFCHTDNDCPGGKSCAPPTIAGWWGFCS